MSATEQDRAGAIARAGKWLWAQDEYTEERRLIRDLYLLATDPPPAQPAQPAAIGLSRSQFAEERWGHWSSPMAGRRILAELAAADALLAAAGLAWKAEEAEAGEAEPGQETAGEQPDSPADVLGGKPSKQWVAGTGPVSFFVDAKDGLRLKMSASETEPEAADPPKPRWVSWTGPGLPDSVFDPAKQESVPLEDWLRRDPPPTPEEADLVAACPTWVELKEARESHRVAWQAAEQRRQHEACEAEFAEARRQEADAALGARMRELLADDEPPRELESINRFDGTSGAWAWLRQQAGLAGGEEASQPPEPEPLPERIGWASDSFAPRADGCPGPGLLWPPGASADAVYAEAVRRYNLHGKIEAWARDRLVGPVYIGLMPDLQAELLAILAEGRP